MVLIGQIFLIVCLQGVLEMFISQTKSPDYLKNMLSIAAYAGSFYLVLRFVFDNLVKEIFEVFRVVF